jgi:hypothetical protein
VDAMVVMAMRRGLMPTPPWAQLPTALMDAVLLFLPTREHLLGVERVCLAWRHISRCGAALAWRDIGYIETHDWLGLVDPIVWMASLGAHRMARVHTLSIQWPLRLSMAVGCMTALRVVAMSFLPDHVVDTSDLEPLSSAGTLETVVLNFARLSLPAGTVTWRLPFPIGVRTLSLTIETRLYAPHPVVPYSTTWPWTFLTHLSLNGVFKCMTLPTRGQLPSLRSCQLFLQSDSDHPTQTQWRAAADVDLVPAIVIGCPGLTSLKINTPLPAWSHLIGKLSEYIHTLSPHSRLIVDDEGGRHALCRLTVLWLGPLVGDGAASPTTEVHEAAMVRAIACLPRLKWLEMAPHTLSFVQLLPAALTHLCLARSRCPLAPTHLKTIVDRLPSLKTVDLRHIKGLARCLRRVETRTELVAALAIA